MIRAIIVEDEKCVTELIAEMVTEIDPDIAIVSVCDNFRTAYDKIVAERPDLVFLDIMIPGGTTFDLLRSLGDIDFEIVFISAYSEYIAEAVRFAPNGYIQKPINIADLRMAISHARKRISQGLNAKEMVGNLMQLYKREERKTRLVIPTVEEYLFVAIDDIIRCESSNVYTYIHTVDRQRILSSYTLKQMFAALPHDAFFQIHKSHVIAIDKVERYNIRDLSITMLDKTSLPVSRNRKDEFLNHFVRVSRQAGDRV